MAAGLEDADAGLVCFLPAPNHVEAGPNKLFEYMAAGLPVIASDFPAWRPIVEGNDCGLCVDPADPAAIARAILYLAENPGRRAEMGANGRRAVMERYNWEAEGRRLIAAYERLTRRTPDRAP
jgi:glycosyltransferase involved in cell wall biosynthesis